MKQTKQLFTMLLGIFIAAALIACTPTVSNDGSQPDLSSPDEEPAETDETDETATNDLAGTQWDLISVGDLDMTGLGMTLDFEDETLGGSDSCNTFGNSYKIENDTLVFDGPFVSTLMACLEMENGAKYTEALSTAGAFALSNGQLVIQTDSGELTFVPAASADLENTKWGLSGMNSGDAIVSMGIDQEIFLRIDEEGIGGNGGCNLFGGSAEVDGNQITFSEIFSTQMFCEDDGISEREMEFFAMLDQVTSFTILRDRLTVFNDAGQVIGMFNAMEDDMNGTTLFVGPEQVDCVGVAPQKCLLVKEDPNGEYTYFYNNIEGFEWEEGFEYELIVNITDVENPPADASSLRYELVEIVSKTAVDQSADLTGMMWSLANLLVGGDAVYPAPAGSNVYFELSDDGMISGHSGCNRFNGQMAIDGNSIEMGPLISTRMACSEEIMGYESTFLSHLEQAGTFASDGNMLRLFSADGLLLAEFTPAEVITLYVGPEQVDCEGIAPQKCLLVKENLDDEYTFFYDSIEGFEWEEGFDYELMVSVTEQSEPLLADASSLVYKLVQLVSKTPAAE